MTVTTNFHLLSEDPLVVVISSGLHLATGLLVARRYARGRRCHVAIQPAWHFPSQLAEILPVIRSARQAHPGLAPTFLCPTPEDAQVLREHGLDTLHVHTNAFIDHRIFRPRAPRRLLAAAHVASVEPFKRHPLAWGVEDIGVITYDWRGCGGYAQLHGYRHLRFANFSIRDGQCHLGPRLSSIQVAQVVSASACGLILSAAEGQNNASTEYLLCGVPVVSTPSIGGRDALLDPEHSRIVPPEPGAVEDAVRHFARAAIDPHTVRASVMRKLREHRQRFLAWWSTISDRDLLAEADADLWHPRFIHQMRLSVRV